MYQQRNLNKKLSDVLHITQLTNFRQQYTLNDIRVKYLTTIPLLYQKNCQAKANFIFNSLKVVSRCIRRLGWMCTCRYVVVYRKAVRLKAGRMSQSKALRPRRGYSHVRRYSGSAGFFLILFTMNWVMTSAKKIIGYDHSSRCDRSFKL